MRKIIIILFIVFNIVFNLFSQDIYNEEITRKILILPFFNKTEVEEYDYLSDLLMETLRVELRQIKKFEFTNFSITNYKIEKLGYQKKEYADMKIAQEIAVELGADIVIFGQYVILEEEIVIFIHVVDIFTGDLVTASKIKGSTGLDLFSIVDNISKEVITKLLENLDKLKISYIQEMERRQKKKERQKKLERQKEIERQKELEQKNTLIQMIKDSDLLPRHKVGIVLTSLGTALILSSLPILISAPLLFGNVISNNKSYYEDTDNGYVEYLEIYNVFVGLFSTGLSFLCCGLIFTVIGIPLIVFQKIKTNKDVSLNIYYNKELRFDVCFKI